MHHRTTDAFAGLSQRQVLKCSMKNENLRKFNVKFTNKAKPRPVKVKRIHQQHQIDLVDMKRMQVLYNGKKYRYILSLMDLFSRFHWLAPLELKTSHNVKEELYRIYAEHGIPEILQSDNGGEFKKHVAKFCKNNKIKMIRCRPYNPKAQGKVERSHRVLRRKIYYDLVKQRKTGVNWVENLPEYMKCLNNEKREELSWKSAFEIYFGRKANELINEGKNYNDSIDTASTIKPSTKDFSNQKEQANQWRNLASKADSRMAKRMMEKDARKNKYRTYKPGDRVFIRVGGKKSRSSGNFRVLVGNILKCYNDEATYNVQFQMPGSKKLLSKKIRVEDIADCPTKETESNKKKRSSQKEFQNNLLIPLTRYDRLSQITDQGFTLAHDPAGDGNCQFSAMCYALGLQRSVQSLRMLVVNYLRNNNIINNAPLDILTGIPLHQYLEQMAEDGTYGDEITLHAISNMFDVQITIVSSLGQEGRVEILPENTIPFGRIILGHFAEGHGDHYIALEELNQDPTGDDSYVISEDEFSELSNDNDNSISNLDQLPLENLDDINHDNHELAENIEISNTNTNSNSNLEQLPIEILERIFLSALTSSDYSFPNHVCWTLNNMLAAIPSFQIFERIGMRHLPRIYMNNPSILPKARATGEIHVNMQRIVRAFGSLSGTVLELKRIVSHTKWNSAWIILIAEVYGWYLVKNIYWKSKNKS